MKNWVLYLMVVSATLTKSVLLGEELNQVDVIKDWDDVTKHDEIFVQPQQIHLSLADNGSSFVVTWNTINRTETSKVGCSFVKYGNTPTELEHYAKAHESKFQDLGKMKRIQYIHRAKLYDLKPQRFYFYRVGNNLTMSDLFYFKSLPEPSNTHWSPRLAIFGDMGNTNAQSLPRLQKDALNGMYDTIFHVGDFAYDMDQDNGNVGDEFMRQIEPIAGYIPYMTTPGNHEHAYNFSHYKARFTMPEDKSWHEMNRNANMFYSFNLGPLHIIAVDTEYYYFLNYGTRSAISQYHWLVEDLRKATLLEERRKHPWIIIMGHRPMYCSGKDKDDCKMKNTATRVGLPKYGIDGMEKLLMKYKVDVAIWAHEHNYERMWPVYNYKVVNGSYQEPYRNPKGPVHINTGSAGCDELKEDFIRDEPYFSAFRSTDYGYTRLTVHNFTHLEFNQVSDDKDGEIIDQFFIIKDNVEPKFEELP